MKKLVFFLLTISLILFTGALSTVQAGTFRQEKLKIYTDSFEPLNYLENDKLTGLAADVVQELIKRTRTKADIKVTAWEEGYKAVMERPNTALFSMAMTPERKPMFQWVGPIAIQDTNLYAKKGAETGIFHLEDAKKVSKIVVVKDYESEELLKKEGFTNLDTVMTEDAAIKKLLSGEAELFPSGNITMPSLLKNNGATMNDIEKVFNLSTNMGYIAFSEGTSPQIVALWQKKLDEMKTDGSFEKIYLSYIPGADMTGLLTATASGSYYPGECSGMSKLPPKEKKVMEFVCKAKALALANMKNMGKEAGLAATFREFDRQASDPECKAGKCRFQKGELYIYAYENEMKDGRVVKIKCLAHGANPSMIGKDFFNAGFAMKAYPQYGIEERKDAKFFQMVSDAAYRKNGYSDGFVMFTWPNPADNDRIWLKKGYSTKLTDTIWIGSGIYIEKTGQ